MSRYFNVFATVAFGFALGLVSTITYLKLSVVSLNTQSNNAAANIETANVLAIDEICAKRQLEKDTGGVQLGGKNSVKAPVEDANMHGRTIQQDVTSIKTHFDDSREELMDLQVSPEIRQWISGHQTHIQNTLSNIMPDEISEEMKTNIFEKSLFLENMEKTEGDASDENWGYEKTQELWGIIAHHPLSAEYEVASITCKQLMCEVIGLVYNTDSWMEIHVAIFQNATNIIPGWPNDGRPPNISFRSDGKVYMYTTYGFTQ